MPIASRAYATVGDLRDAVRGRAGVSVRSFVRAVDDGEALPESPTIEARDGAYIVIEGETETSFDTRAEALGHIQDSAWFADAVSRKSPESDAYTGLAEPRWFDAAAAEDLPSATDGSQVTDASIDEMVRNLAAEKTAIPIDGGNISEVHESVWNTAARAAGWAFAAVSIRDEAGQAHIWLYARALPEVDQQIDAGELLFGSIAFVPEATHRYTDEAIGARLISYALTNRPFIEGLEPHAARSHQLPGRPAVAVSRSHEVMTMPTDKNTPEREAALQKVRTLLRVDPAAERGQILDALKGAAANFGVDVTEEMDAYDLAWSIEERAFALASAESVESVLASFGMGGAPAPAGDGDDGEEGERGQGEGEPTARALLEGFESEETQDAFTSDILGSLRDIFAQEEGAPAELLDLLRSSVEAFKGALGGEGDPAEDGMDSERGQELLGLLGLRDANGASLPKILTAVRTMAGEVKELRVVAKRGEIGEHLRAAARERQVTEPAGEELTELTELCITYSQGGADWKPLADKLSGTREAPKPGTETDAAGKGARSYGTVKEACAAIRTELLTAEPTLKKNVLRKRAYAVAKERHPELFGATTA